MKKITLLLCAFALLTSCNKDDDNGSSQDLLIGTWKYYKAFEDGVEFSLTDCEKQETQVFNADGTFTVVYYDDFDGPCVEDGTLSGTWSNNGNNVYAVNVFGETITQPIIFEENTYSVTSTDSDGPEYIDVYIRN